MLSQTIVGLQNQYGIPSSVIKLIQKTEAELTNQFKKIDEIREFNQYKVLRAFQKEQVGLRHFAPTSGYGYDDIGRDTLERLYANVFACEDALVRPQIASGTHALAISLYALLRPGDRLLSLSGKPYDTLEEVIGIHGSKGQASLLEYGIKYSQVDLNEDGSLDLQNLSNYMTPDVKVVFMQRSRGYDWRPSLTIKEIDAAVQQIRQIRKDVLIMVDNCYGEFTEISEPTEVGVDLIAGSLIKNPGGGIAPTGGYVAGRTDLVEKAAYRLTCPGIGREVGSHAGGYTPFYQGFFMAPHIVGESIQGAILAAKIFEKLKYEVTPSSQDPRSDIIQSIKFKSADLLIAFCQGIQKAAPIDSNVTPEPWDMPGYQHQVIMAAGAFVQGSSIELSADAPIKEPYIAYMQGGLTYHHCKIGIMIAIAEMVKRKMIDVNELEI